LLQKHYLATQFKMRQYQTMTDDTVEFFEVFPWNPNLATGIEKIDEQHKQLIHLLNKLASHIAYQSEDIVLEEVFDELVAYTDYHFKTEESIWEPYFKDDQRFTSHQVTHQSFITNLLKLKNESADKTFTQSLYDILKFLTHWLAYHILDSDIRMGKTIQAIDSGLSLERAKEHADHELSGSMKVLIETVLNMYDTLSERTLDLMKEKNERKHMEMALKKANAQLESRVSTRTKELVESENRFRSLINLAPLPICAYDDDLNITLLNEKFVSLLGYNLEDIPKLKDWWYAAYPDQEYRHHVADTWRSAEEKSTRLGITLEPLEFKVTCKDGTVRDILFNSGSVGNNLNLVILHDLTERNHMEEALISSQEQFYQAQKNEAIGALVGGIAHDFNNMLAGIAGNVFLTKLEHQNNPSTIEKLDIIEEISFRATEMIRQLLIFARKGDVSLQPLSLSLVIKETIKFLRSSIPENITFNQNIISDELPIIGNATQLHQLLMNLVNNARDAVEGRENPCISIEVSLKSPEAKIDKNHAVLDGSSYAHLRVEDNGCGMTEDIRNQIFEPFFSTKDPGKGTGLGLPMVFGVIKTHNGFIDVESAEGEGTIINIYFPLQNEPLTPEKPTKTKRTLQANGERVLVADDDKAVLDISRRILEAMNFSVTVASDGQEALDIFMKNQKAFDLVILDIVMPKLGGVETAMKMLEARSDIKFIFQTGYDRDSALNNMPSLKKFSVITKPYTSMELSSALSKQLGLNY